MMAKCFICDTEVIWENDWDAENDYGYEDAGIIHTYHCPSCGAEYEVFEKFNDENKLCE